MMKSKDSSCNDKIPALWKFPVTCDSSVIDHTYRLELGLSNEVTVNAIDPAVPSQPRERWLPDIFPSYTIWTCQPSRRVISGHFPITHRC